MERAFQILNDLEREGVIGRYAIGGAVGAIFYMEPFLTYDLDVFLVLPETPGGLLDLAPLYRALHARGCQECAECMEVAGVPVQFLPAYNDLLREALEEARDTLYNEIPTRVLRPEHLLAIMLQTGRAKDRQRFAAFKAEATFDKNRLDAMVRRHDLAARFTQWTT